MMDVARSQADEDAAERGRRNERRVLLLLTELAPRLGLWGVRAATLEEDRERGIDVVAMELGDEQLGIQVKSSSSAARQFRRRQVRGERSI